MPPYFPTVCSVGTYVRRIVPDGGFYSDCLKDFNSPHSTVTLLILPAKRLRFSRVIVETLLQSFTPSPQRCQPPRWCVVIVQVCKTMVKLLYLRKVELCATIHLPESIPLEGVTIQEVQMNQVNKAQYNSVLGSVRNPVLVALQLPQWGEHGFVWLDAPAIGKEYGHYGYRISPKAGPINVHVYGRRTAIDLLSKYDKLAICELELVVKRLESGREFILINLYLANPSRQVTHEFAIIPAPQNRRRFIYTTKDMQGVGIVVNAL